MLEKIDRRMLDQTIMKMALEPRDLSVYARFCLRAQIGPVTPLALP